MPRTKTLYDYYAEKDELHENKRHENGSRLYRTPWNTCDPETPAEHFYQHVVQTLRESDQSKASFEYALYAGDEDNPTGLLIQHRHAEDSKFINSGMPGVKRALEAAGYSYVHVFDGRYRDNKKPTQVIVTGHACAGGELPLQVRRDIETAQTKEKQVMMP